MKEGGHMLRRQNGNSGLTKVRDSNIELYRIISMFLIIAHHYVANSGLTTESYIFSNQTASASLFLLVWGAFGKIGINCFVLITGYFMCTSNISAKKFAKLFFELLFYRYIINAIFWATGYAPFTLKGFIKVLLPVTSVAQNFTGTFLLFFLCIPFLNILIHNLTEKQHLKLLALVVLIYVLFKTLPLLSVSMNYVSWYMVLFFTASYIRLYPKSLFEKTKFWGILSAICVFLCCVSVIACAWIGQMTGYIMPFYFVSDSNTLLAFLTGISSFMFFKNLKLKPSRLINTVSSTTFGILLIHANSDTMRQWLWQDVLKNLEVFGTNWVYLHAVLSVVLVFIICFLIDYLRICFIEKPFFVFWDKHFEKLASKYAALEEKVCQKFKIGNLNEEQK